MKKTQNLYKLIKFRYQTIMKINNFKTHNLKIHNLKITKLKNQQFVN